MDNPGFLFMFGIYGTTATKETVRLLQKTGACGVLLLARNIEDAAQTRALTEDLVQKVGRPLLFSVDHEGGWVLRFKRGVTAFPGNAALGATKDADMAYAVGQAMGRELAWLGIRINLAPVLDVVSSYNPGIGIRSFGENPVLAGRLGAAMIRGMQENGVCATAKHFPGKGAARVDSHVALPVITIPPARFAETHLAPFKDAIAEGVDCVMTSHVRFPKLDKAPATFSTKITRDLLRKKLGFEGAVISDDLCMGAIARQWPIQLASGKALEAGHDILLIAHAATAQEEAAELLAAQAEESPELAEQIKQSRRRINKLFKRQKPGEKSRPMAADALSDRIADLAVETAQRGRMALPLAPEAEPLLVIVPDFTEVEELFTFEGGVGRPEEIIEKIAARWGRAKIRRAPVQSPVVGALAREIQKSKRILFFCFEAMRFPGQRATLDILKREAPGRTVVCLIRNSWDKGLLAKAMTAVDTKGYRLSQLRAGLNLILSGTSS